MDTYGSGESMLNYNSNKFFGVDRSSLTNDYLQKRESGEIGGSKASRFLEDTIRNGMYSGKSTTEIIEELKNSTSAGGGDLFGQLQDLESRGTPLGKIAGRLKKDLLREVRGMSGSKSAEDRRKALIEERADMFGSNSVGGIIDFNMLSGKVNELDSTTLEGIFGAKSNVNIKTQAELAKLMEMMSSDTNMADEFAAIGDDADEMAKFLKNKGINLSAGDVGGETGETLRHLFKELHTSGVSDAGKAHTQGFFKRLNKNLSEQTKYEKQTARADLYKYTFDQGFMGTDQGKLLKSFADSGDITDLDKLVKGLTHEGVSGMQDGKSKDLLANVFAHKKAYESMDMGELVKKAEGYGLSEEEIKKFSHEGLATRLASEEILKEGKAGGNKSNDELIAEAGGYSAEVAQAVSEATIATTRYVEETSNTIDKQRVFNEKTAEAIIKITNAMKVN
jgi:hypothetical protein